MGCMATLFQLRSGIILVKLRMRAVCESSSSLAASGIRQVMAQPTSTRQLTVPCAGHVSAQQIQSF